MLQCCSGCTCSRQPATSRAAETAPILPCPRSSLRVYLSSLSRVTWPLSASLRHVSRGCNVSGHELVSSLRQSSARTERVSAAGACKRRCLDIYTIYTLQLARAQLSGGMWCDLWISVDITAASHGSTLAAEMREPWCCVLYPRSHF